MIHTKDKLLLKTRPIDFSELVLHPVVVLLLLTNTCGGQSQVIGTSQPIVAMVGDDVILPCRLATAVDATDLTVEWARPDLDPRFVHLRRDSVELQLEEHPLYRRRTSLSSNNLKCGDVSLKVSKVKVSDAGSYRCLVPKARTDVVFELIVGSVASTVISLSGIDEATRGVMLDCRSEGWYPEPEVLWLDGEGNLLSAGPPETVRGPDDLYTVSSRVTVEKRHSNSFTCRVHQKNTNQTRDTHIQVPDDLIMVQCDFTARIIIVLLVCCVPIVAVVFIVWKGGQNKTKTSNSSRELQLLMEGEYREKLMTTSERMKYLDNTKVKLNEDLRRTDGELKHVDQVITTLKNQKKDLIDQRGKLTSLHQDDKIQIEKYKKKEEDTTIIKKDKKKKAIKAIKDFERRETVHEKLLENTDKQLETTEEMINKMTERKGKLERDKEQMNKHLEETERQRDELQKKLHQEQSEREEDKNNPSSNEPL